VNAPKNSPDTDSGAILRKRRMLRGQSLEAVHQHTRVPKRLLEALESNDEKAFPARIYMRGFMKTYCEYLELEFAPLWVQYEKPVSPPPAPNEENVAAPPKKIDGERAFYLPLSESTLLPVLLVGGLVIFGGLTWALKEKPAPVVTPSPQMQPLHLSGDPTAPIGPATLTLTAGRDTIVRISVDGRPRFEGRIPKNRQQQWQAHKGFSLHLSDPTALRAELNGTPLSLANMPSDNAGWRHITLPPVNDTTQ
jgi:hypothetical protein